MPLLPAQGNVQLNPQQVMQNRGRNLVPVPLARIIPIFEEEYCSDAALLDVLDHRFCFNGESHSMGGEIDWLTNPSQDIEWQILLHKFYCAPGLARKYAATSDARYRDCFQELVESWILQIRPGFIAADVTARRVQNWLYAWRLFRQHEADGLPAGFEQTLLQSLVGQVDWICANLAPARNHRTMELYSIFLASVAIPAAWRNPHWRELSVSGMLTNIESDLLPDGVHCELSTDYHHIVLRSYLLFLRLAQMHDIAIPHQAKRRIELALEFAMHIHRPDGDIPALSDSDSRSFLQLLEWGGRLFGRDDFEFVASRGRAGEPPERQHRHFARAGYTVLRSPWQSGEAFGDARYLVFDCGPVGAGNHGHLDALSFEAAAFGRSLVVDPGRYTYDEQGPYNWRAHFRRTSAHNTVTVEDRDQAIYRQRGAKMKIFQPHPQCSLLAREFGADYAYLHGMLTSPNYSAVHHRHIWFVDNHYWIILDRLRAADAHQYDLRFQLTAEAFGNVKWRESDGCTRVVAPGFDLFIAMPRVSVGQEVGFVSHEYGHNKAAPLICARAVAADHDFISVLYPTRASSAATDITGTVCGRRLSIDDRERHDTWEWDADSQQVLFDSAGAVRTWRLAEAGRDS